MSRVVLSALCVVLSAGMAFSRTVKTETVVANPGVTVSVPVSVDAIDGAASAVVTIGYDATVLVCLGADAGELAVADDMTYLDSGAGRLCAVFSKFRKSSGGGELVRLRFSVRDGTQGHYSDVTVLDAQFGSVDGVTDLSAANPVSTVNGMIRVVASDAAVFRLEEPFAVWSKTALKTVTFGTGDGIMASDDGEPIVVAQVVSASEPIAVRAPVGGWRTGGYALLSTPTAGLTFSVQGTDQVNVRTTEFAGMTTYWVDVTVEGDIAITVEEGELPKATLSQIRSSLADLLTAHPEVTSVVVKGDPTLIPVVVDLGIVPNIGISGETATATYAKPTLAITEFNPKSGRVRIKVMPGEGNSIRSALATGCIHVYGTQDLSEKMKYISGASFDLTSYLRNETRGEADIVVSLGAYTFIKVKAETSVKKEGDTE